MPADAIASRTVEMAVRRGSTSARERVSNVGLIRLDLSRLIGAPDRPTISIRVSAVPKARSWSYRTRPLTCSVTVSRVWPSRNLRSADGHSIDRTPGTARPGVTLQPERPHPAPVEQHVDRAVAEAPQGEPVVVDAADTRPGGDQRQSRSMFA